MAYIAIDDVTSSSIDVYLDGLDSGYSFSGRSITWYLDNVSKATYSIDAYVSSGGWHTFTGLKPNTSYSIKAVVSGIQGMGSVTFTESVKTNNTFVSKWSWSSSNGDATDTQTYTAYTALINKGLTSDFSYKVWNDMVSKIAEIRTAYSSSVANIGEWDSYYASLPNTKMTASDKILTATRFNSLRYNIGSVYSGGSGVSEVSTGDIVYGSYFTTIMSRANDWIDTL